MTNTYPIYLAGTISGLTYEAASLGWRARFAELVADVPQIQCYSPMRAKDFLADRGKLFGAYDDHPFATEAGILARDRNDVRNCALMVACFLEGEGHYSLGTACEFGWADAFGRPTIMVALEGDPHREHPILRRLAGFIVDTIEEAADVSKKLLLPGI